MNLFNIFKKKDPVCKKVQKKGTGLIDKKTGNWFCGKDCQDLFLDNVKKHEQQNDLLLDLKVGVSKGGQPEYQNKPGCCQ